MRPWFAADSNEAAGFADAGGDRFLDKNVDAGSQQSFAHLEMDRGRRTNRGGVESNFISGARGQTFVHRGEDGQAPLVGGRAGTDKIGLDNRGEPYRRAFIFQRPVHTKMVAAKNACAADENPEMRRAGQGANPEP